MLILKKRSFLVGRSLIFSSRAKTTQNRCQNAFEKGIEKNVPTINFGLRFGFQKLPKNRPNIHKNRKKLPLQKSFKKTAMDLSATRRASPEVKLFGTLPDHPTTIPMISTSLSIYISIYLSIDLPLVALIIKVRSAT